LFRADLHCHSTCSDGTLSPVEIVELAKERGLSGLSITDHDCIDAYETAIPAAKKAGIRLGNGVEFSSVDQRVSVHVLGYDFDLEDKGIADFCRRHIERRKDRNHKIFEKLKSHGMEINPEKLEEKMEEGRPVGRPHIAQALMEKGYVSDVKEAFYKWIGDGKPCYDPGFSISTDETIAVIHNAGGKAFIAHPHLMRRPQIVTDLLKKPFDGIEGYYSKCSPDREARWVRVAKERNLLISGGSDFHGAIKPAIALGCSWVGQEMFGKIFQRAL